MKCPKCGKELNEGDHFCTECGTKIELPKPQEKRIVNSMENSTFLCMISIICYFGWPFVAGLIGLIGEALPIINTLQGICGLLPIAGFILAIVAWAKYPKTTFPKVLVIVYAVLFILALILIIIIAAACTASIGTFLENCENLEVIKALWL